MNIRLNKDAIIDAFRMFVIIGVVLFCIVITTGCSKTPQPASRVITEVETVTVKVPVLYQVPDLDCEFSGEGITPITKLLDCLVLHKRVLDDIRNHNTKVKEGYESTLK